MLSSVTVTQLLVRWSQGDESALERLTPFVYEELRRLAGSYLRRERPDHTLQATALVHEAYLQLLGMQQVEWRNRSHLIGMAAQMMRHILVDHARKREASKRGGEAFRISLSRAQQIPADREIELVALHEALATFAVRFPRQAQVVELRFFGGLTAEETSQVQKSSGIETSTRTVERDWRFARAWLLNEIENR